MLCQPCSFSQSKKLEKQFSEIVKVGCSPLVQVGCTLLAQVGCFPFFAKRPLPPWDSFSLVRCISLKICFSTQIYTTKIIPYSRFFYNVSIFFYNVSIFSKNQCFIFMIPVSCGKSNPHLSHRCQYLFFSMSVSSAQFAVSYFAQFSRSILCFLYLLFARSRIIFQLHSNTFNS